MERSLHSIHPQTYREGDISGLINEDKTNKIVLMQNSPNKNLYIYRSNGTFGRLRRKQHDKKVPATLNKKFLILK